MTLSLVLWLFACHYLCDWVLQTRAQANTKGHDNVALTRHVATYSLGMLIGMACYPPIGSHPLPSPRAEHLLQFIGLNAVLHWATDWLTSRFNTWARAGATDLKDIPKLWWCGIGGDQLIHQVTLVLTAHYLLT